MTIMDVATVYADLPGAMDWVEAPVVLPGRSGYLYCGAVLYNGVGVTGCFMAGAGEHNGWIMVYLLDKNGDQVLRPAQAPNDGGWNISHETFVIHRGHVRILVPRWTIVHDGIASRENAGMLVARALPDLPLPATGTEQ